MIFLPQRTLRDVDKSVNGNKFHVDFSHSSVHAAFMDPWHVSAFASKCFGDTNCLDCANAFDFYFWKKKQTRRARVIAALKTPSIGICRWKFCFTFEKMAKTKFTPHRLCIKLCSVRVKNIEKPIISSETLSSANDSEWWQPIKFVFRVNAMRHDTTRKCNNQCCSRKLFIYATHFLRDNKCLTFCKFAPKQSTWCLMHVSTRTAIKSQQQTDNINVSESIETSEGMNILAKSK